MRGRTSRPIARLMIGASLGVVAQFGLLSQPASAGARLAPRPAVGITAQARAVPAGAIVFSHEESGSTNPSLLYSNLYAMDAQTVAPPVRVTNFGFPTRVELPVWSKDQMRLAFDSDVNDGLRSLEVKSAYSIAPTGGNLRQMTGFGVIGSLPGPTRTITGHVQAPSQPLLGTGSVTGCVITVQGAPQNVSCAADGSFTVNAVPVTSGWVRVQASVTYPQYAGGPWTLDRLCRNWKLVRGRNDPAASPVSRVH
jgi:hypothetical protein